MNGNIFDIMYMCKIKTQAAFIMPSEVATKVSK